MIKNKVIEILEKEVGTDVLSFISGSIYKPGTNDCNLSEGRGSVYGIAVKLSNNDELNCVFVKCDKKNMKISDWKSIGDDYYPLYWGKDVNMGARLYSHTKASKSTGTIQLNDRTELEGKDIIYGAIPCSNYEEIEKRLHKKYPDIYKTKKLAQNGIEELSINGLSIDENSYN